MEMQRILVLAIFILLSFRMGATINAVRKRGGELYGRPAITDFVVYFSKFAALFPPFLLMLHSAGLKFPVYHLPQVFRFVGLFILIVASVFLYLSLADLGKFTKMGLPKNDSIQLQTTGIYRFSRNPMYLGVMLLALASTILVPNLLSVIFAVIGITLHHQIILKEEKFLRKTFGNQYQDYSAKTRRYL